MTTVSVASSCRHMFASRSRVKRSDSRVGPLIWLQLLLVVLLAEKASCEETSAATSLPPSTTAAQAPVQYVIDVTVDVTAQGKDESHIRAWLVDVFQGSLESCVSPDTLTTTATTAGTAGSNTTSVTLNSTTTATLEINKTTTATTLENNNTTAATTESSNTTKATTLENNNTTAATTTTTTESSNTTKATTLENNNSTAATTTTTTTTTESSNITTVTTLENNTTAATITESGNTTKATTLENNNTTAATTTTTTESSNTTKATTLENNNTTAATTTTESSNITTATTLENNTTAAATTQSSSKTTATTLENNTTAATTTTTLESSSKTTATTLENNITAAKTTTTTTTTTPLQSSSTTAATTLKNNITATTTTTTTPRSSSTTAATTQSDSKTNQAATSKGQNMSSSATNSKRRRRSLRLVRAVGSNVTQSSGNNTTTGLFQNVNVSCTDISVAGSKCSVTLQLKQPIPTCCILRTLCAASNASPNISVVGSRVHRDPPQNTCTGPQEDNGCTYTGPANKSWYDKCGAFEAAYNSTSCGPGNSDCSCSSYCNNSDAYYAFQISILNPTLNSSYVSSLMSQTLTRNCSQSSTASCLPVGVKDASVMCGIFVTNGQNCSVILHFAVEVPICAVAAAMRATFQSQDQISYDGSVTRAAICGNSSVSSSLATSQFTWMSLQVKPAAFCMAIQELNSTICENEANVLVLLNESCDQTSATASPNATAAQPKPTTTAPPGNATTVVTVTTRNNTATTANASVSVTPATTAGTNETAAESQASALLDLTKDMSKLNSSQIDQLVSQLESLLSGPNVSLALGNTSVNIVSNLLNASPQQLAQSSTRIIRIVDTVGLKLILGSTAQTLLSPSVALSVKPADGSNFQETFFSISDPSNVQVRGIPRLRRSVATASSAFQASVTLPSSLTHNLSPQQQQLASRVQFNFYQKSTVFQDKSLGTRRLNSGILGASVANLSITGLADNVTIYLRNTEPVPANFVASCVFWDFTLNNRAGGWNPSGCVVLNSTDNVTVCGCNHLTSFAVLLDLSRQPVSSPLQNTILTFITYIGCGVSAVFLSVTLLTYLSFEKLRKDVPSKILIHLCVALLLLNLVFLVDAWLALYTDAVGLCISTAWFLHYFLLASFTWMGLEAVHMYNALVKVFNNNMSHYMLKFFLVGWGLPMVVVIVVIATDKNNYGLVSYGKYTDGRSDEFCWLKSDIAFYVAVVAYFCVIFLFNLVMFVVVLVQLGRIKKQNPHSVRHRSTLEDMRSVAGITVLLGLTWGFAFFAWGPVNLAFMYLFAIFNSFQGLFIFVFYCAVKENVKRQWRTYLCCGDMRLAENSDWSRTATQKTMKKPPGHLKTSQSNSSSSSTSFLVSDSTEQSSSISNPTDDASMDVTLNEINSQSRNLQP